MRAKYTFFQPPFRKNTFLARFLQILQDPFKILRDIIALLLQNLSRSFKILIRNFFLVSIFQKILVSILQEMPGMILQEIIELQESCKDHIDLQEVHFVVNLARFLQEMCFFID